MYVNLTYSLTTFKGCIVNSRLYSGFPTANFDENVIDDLPDQLIGGIYWGFAQVQNGPVYGMVMSIGNNFNCYIVLILFQVC